MTISTISFSKTCQWRRRRCRTLQTAEHGQRREQQSTELWDISSVHVHSSQTRLFDHVTTVNWTSLPSYQTTSPWSTCTITAFTTESLIRFFHLCSEGKTSILLWHLSLSLPLPLPLPPSLSPFHFPGVIDNIYCSLDNDNSVVGIFLDLQKAFDTVNHYYYYTLVYKMYNYGIRGAAYKWFVSYLSNREQYTPCFIKTTSLIAHNFGKCWDFQNFSPVDSTVIV